MSVKNKIMKPIKRGKVVVGVLGAIGGAFKAGYKIDGFKEPRRDVLPKYIQAFCRKSLKAFDVKFVEVEPVPNTHALWVSNHISWLDIPVVGSVSPAFFLSKAEVSKMPIVGTIARIAGTLFIHRGSGDAGSMASQMSKFLTQGYSILFYPEATTTDGTQIKKVYGNLLQAAMDSNVPIQPMVICYVNQYGELDNKVPYFGGISLKDSLLNVIDSNNITAYILPLEPIDPAGKTRRKLTSILQQRMQEGLADLHQRVLKNNNTQTNPTTLTDATPD